MSSNDSKLVNVKVAAALMVTFAFLMILPLTILGSVIDWPANLGEPASVNLPPTINESAGVFAGYFSYLVYSVLFFPMAVMMGRVVVGRDVNNPLLTIANGFALISSVCRAMGLCRWLFAMPVLADIYENGNDMEKAAVEVAYEMLNAWGGGIGEILGVTSFACIWIVCVSVLLIQSNLWPSWLGYVGLAISVDFAVNFLDMEILGVDMGFNHTLAVVLLHFWLFFSALLFLRLPCMARFQVSDVIVTDDIEPTSPDEKELQETQ